MPTRFYFASSGTPGSTPTIDAAWERSSAAFVRAPMDSVKSNTALTTLSAVFGATSTSQTCYYQGVSGPLDVDQVISTSGSNPMVIGKCGETSNSGDAHLCSSVRVLVGDTSTVRGTVSALIHTTSEFPLIASAATRLRTHTGSSVSALAGDRIVVEFGIHGITPANEVMQMRVGDPTGTADFALTAGLTTDLVPWVEFSQNISPWVVSTGRLESRRERVVRQAVKRASSW